MKPLRMPIGKATSIDDAVRALVERENTLVLATIGDDGAPVATPLFYYAGADLNLYWLSSPGSRHSRNLSVRPRVAVAVFAAVRDWKDIRGVQMEGLAEAVTDRQILEQYRLRFALGEELDKVIARSTMYVFRPAWWRYVDSLEPKEAAEKLQRPLVDTRGSETPSPICSRLPNRDGDGAGAERGFSAASAILPPS